MPSRTPRELKSSSAITCPSPATSEATEIPMTTPQTPICAGIASHQHSGSTRQQDFHGDRLSESAS